MTTSADTRCATCAVSSSPEAVDLASIDAIVARIGGTPDKTIPLLQAIQKHYAYLPQAALERVATTTQISATRLAGVSSFYNHFRLKPQGKHHVRVCVGTACHIKGAPRILDALRRDLDIAPDDDTDAARQYTIEGVACLGCCSLAPVMLIDDATYGHLTPDRVAEALEDFKKRGTSKTEGDKIPVESKKLSFDTAEIRISANSCCIASGAGDLYDAVARVVADLDLPVRVEQVGCTGMCYVAPIMEIVMPDGSTTTYSRVSTDDAERIIRKSFAASSPLARLRQKSLDWLDSFLSDRNRTPVERYALDMREGAVANFQGLQKHVALEWFAQLEPLDLTDYEARGGFEAVKQCLSDKSPAEVIEAVERSGLRGRGGAGFPSGRKWRLVREARNAGGGPEKAVIILNGDEGDPGAFMDRMIMESFPFRVIEGMMIAAYAIGASEGVLYIREEYPLAVERMTRAIAMCHELGYLGSDIFGSDFALNLRVMQGAGAFVCGEETALIASIEGHRGTPRLRPPFPAQSGLFGTPTLVNNVETYANIPWIFRKGAEAFAAMGTDTSRGTKVFSLAGKVQRGGLIEVPMGVSISEVVNDIGGGVMPGRTFKAVQIGGPSGGCIPAQHCDAQIDYETLKSHGAIMGSGGLIVLDDGDCMVDVAKYFLSFTQDQSCGRCAPCRVGTRRMLDILERLCAGEGEKGDIERLETLAHTIQKSSLCGLGQTAPNPVLSTIRYFRDEYEAHIEKRCPAGKCTALIRYVIDGKCIGCTLCAQSCPTAAIAAKPYQLHVVDNDKCVRCDICRPLCPTKAITVVSP